MWSDLDNMLNQILANGILIVLRLWWQTLPMALYHTINSFCYFVPNSFTITIICMYVCMYVCNFNWFKSCSHWMRTRAIIDHPPLLPPPIHERSILSGKRERERERWCKWASEWMQLTIRIISCTRRALTWLLSITQLREWCVKLTSLTPLSLVTVGVWQSHRAIGQSRCAHCAWLQLLMGMCECVHVAVS